MPGGIRTPTAPQPPTARRAVPGGVRPQRLARRPRASRCPTDSAPFRGRTPPGTARPTPAEQALREPPPWDTGAAGRRRTPTEPHRRRRHKDAPHPEPARYRRHEDTAPQTCTGAAGTRAPQAQGHRTPNPPKRRRHPAPQAPGATPPTRTTDERLTRRARRTHRPGQGVAGRGPRRGHP
ncbi:hypothetical protein ACH49_11435 [Streptomyces leeuwenhoekii]|uniref:Uncharacterized protein n=1 Tax=Streptomyces leeuwenhoekii TaxID=1437453 RepID=A0ABR5I006_STRLW|nr:hypothetical protein ACH49_11435 [Streptomyces leeuwenhoekii]